MSCEHDIIFEITDSDDASFYIDVRDFVDRIISPNPYEGQTTVTPSDERQTLPTRGKTVATDITVLPAPTESLATSENGTFLPSSGNVGFSEVVVDVEPSLESLSVTENGLYLPESGTDGFDRVSVNIPIPTFETEEKTVTENGVYLPSAGKDGISKVTVDVPMGEWSAPTLVYEGDFDAVTNAFSVTELPNGQPFSFDRIVVELSNVQQGQNVNKRTYWRSDMPMSGYNEPLIIDGGSQYRTNTTYHATTTITIEDDTYIGLVAVNYDENNPTSTAQAYQRKAHGGYDKITAYAWWSWNCPAGAHIKITGYNRTS